MIHNHRQVYRVIRTSILSGRDPKLLSIAKKLRKKGLGWRYDGLGDWTTEAIFEKLQTFGIDTCQEHFEQQARDAGRTLELEERWRKGVVIDGGMDWDDFPFLASEALWNRLTPNLLCPEIVAGRIEAVMDAAIKRERKFDASDKGADFDAAGLLMDYLESFEPDKRDAAFDEVMNCSTYEFGVWLEDIVLNYGHQFVDQVRRIAEVMRETVLAEDLWVALADVLRAADLCDEAVTQARANLARWPERFWVQASSAGLFRDLGQLDSALECLTNALRYAKLTYEWDHAAENVQSLLDELGRGEEWDALAKDSPRPANKWISSSDDISCRELTDDYEEGGSEDADFPASEASPDAVSAPAPLVSEGKIGRNEPCPCGSGKKYKKCCLGRE